MTLIFSILYGFRPKESLDDKAFTLARFTTKKLFSQTSSRYPVPSPPKPSTPIHPARPFPTSPGSIRPTAPLGPHVSGPMRGAGRPALGAILIFGSLPAL